MKVHYWTRNPAGIALRQIAGDEILACIPGRYAVHGNFTDGWQVDEIETGTVVVKGCESRAEAITEFSKMVESKSDIEWARAIEKRKRQFGVVA